ncbi:DUF1499 domain-containing protein [Sulfitobacter guttiformis]|uniref:Uncharacterized protein DUF1499 n=1 Tax=Sulfitobacter guttiformis TaxID=74349 RepID=A0A420DMT4_9RHOB|nr:DUF1499 domain-containing protein [Sulfitobacter guttiformis]KIN72818.1 DUF1499 domain containing protein [Sulfitobacter guttiformis KCTC 32187]RKE95510.1 uncharacterized protein DUF1499 [Sulfitobacter guttiformis]
MVWLILVLAVVAGMAFIRLAPSDVSRWHRPIGEAENTDGEGWSGRVVQSSPGLLSDLHQGMLALPRTELLSGGVGEGRLTYITRSKLMGFPDYTTIEQDGDQIKLYARLRFGKSDMGVNGKRLDGLIERARAKRAER